MHDTKKSFFATCSFLDFGRLLRHDIVHILAKDDVLGGAVKLALEIRFHGLHLVFAADCLPQWSLFPLDNVHANGCLLCPLEFYMLSYVVG